MNGGRNANSSPLFSCSNSGATSCRFSDPNRGNGSDLQLIPDVPGRDRLGTDGHLPLGPTGTIAQGSKQQDPQHQTSASNAVLASDVDAEAPWHSPLPSDVSDHGPAPMTPMMTICSSRSQCRASTQGTIDLPGRPLQIRAELSRWITDSSTDVVITSGGTGLRPGRNTGRFDHWTKQSEASANCWTVL